MLQATSYKPQANEGGFSLFEILIAMAVFAVVGVTIAQLITVSLQADKTSGQKTAGVGLAQETISAVNSTVTEKWNNIYNLNKGSGNKYYPANTAALCGSVKWCLTSGTESVAVNNLTYKRYLYIDNVSRTGGVIDTTYNGANDDPSTQKITVVVSWEDSGANQLGSITLSNYLTRSRNTAAMQDSWDDSAAGTAPTAGENGSFGTGVTSLATTTISTSTPAGSLTLKSQ